LLLAEEQRLDEAVEPLATAVELSPGDARKRYNYGLTLHHLGKRRKAEVMYLKAHETAPGDPDIVNALAVFFIQEQRWYRALTYAEKLVQLLPQAPGPQQMVKQLYQQLKRSEEKNSSS
jgi:Flp pilus assembly protein TadD